MKDSNQFGEELKSRRQGLGLITKTGERVRGPAPVPDGFTIRYRNGEAVPVLFSLDCCDREVVGRRAASGGASGEMVRELMTESERRP